MRGYVNAIGRRLKKVSSRFSEAYNILLNTRQGHMDQYSDKFPNPQNILDLFDGNWASKFPAPFDTLRAGDKELFNDPRLEWALGIIGDIKGKRSLELGPLEGGHAYTLHKHGSSVVSIEANPRAYLKCLAVKQILHLNQVEFLYGDFMKYLQADTSKNFDLSIASGVLYHMCQPVELIHRLAQSSSQVYIWTHYYDEQACKNNPRLKNRFVDQRQSEYQGFKHTLYRFNYKSNGGWTTFYGGPAPYSNWLSRADIVASCQYFGFEHIQINYDTLNHIHGPSFALIASKKPF